MVLKIDDFVLDVFDEGTYLIVKDDLKLQEHDQVVFRNRIMKIQKITKINNNNRIGLKIEFIDEAPLV